MQGVKVGPVLAGGTHTPDLLVGTLSSRLLLHGCQGPPESPGPQPVYGVSSAPGERSTVGKTTTRHVEGPHRSRWGPSTSCPVRHWRRIRDSNS